MHLNDGFTALVLAVAGGLRTEVKTECIPRHLRAMGSRFVFILPELTPEPGDLVQRLTWDWANFEIEEIAREESER